MPSQIVANGGAWLDATELVTLGAEGGYSTLVSMQQASNVFLLSAVEVLKRKWIWEDSIDPIDDATWQSILDGLAIVQGELMINVGVGTIFWSVAILTQSNLIIPIGQTLLQADYPELAAVVPPSWLVGADIQLPNMIMTGIIAAQDVPSIGQITGSNTHTLTDAEMPTHTHIQNPHSHTYSDETIVPFLAVPGPEPVSLVTPIPAVTGQSVATNQDAGGGQPHNNVQLSLQMIPYLVIR